MVVIIKSKFNVTLAQGIHLYYNVYIELKDPVPT